HDALRGVVEVGGGHDDGRVLAAHFRDARFRGRLGEVMIDFQTNRLRAGEDEAVHLWIGDEFSADSLSWTGDKVEHAWRQSGIAQHFSEAEAGKRSVAGGLENDGVACG